MNIMPMEAIPTSHF